MNIKLELIQNHLSDCLSEAFEMNVINADEIADSSAINILDKIKQIINDDSLTDFGAIEKIVCVLEENNISCGTRHNF
jgi:hypothetical protein